jgi:hypothetical protein
MRIYIDECKKVKEKKMTVKLIVTDMDETFLRADKTYDKEKASKVFSKLADQGIIFAIASGNFAPLLENYFNHDILNYVYLAGDDGNVLKNSEEILRTLPIEPSDVKAIYQFFADKNGYYPIFSTGSKAYVKGPVNDWADEQISLYYGDYILIDAFKEIPSEKDIVKIEMLSEYPLAENKQVMIEIEEKFPGISSVTSGEEWLDVYHKDGGKGEAVKFLQEKYNISKEETMCFGDSLNDLSMMNEARYSVAMANADNELKEHCRYEIGTSEDQAVLKILKKITEDKNLNFLEQYRA